MKLYQRIAHDLDWSERNGKADEYLDYIEKNLLPHGSGIDSGCKIGRGKYSRQRFYIHFGFHHMDENGYYDGWTDYRATIQADLVRGFDLSIHGENRNDIKSYLREMFSHVLGEEFVDQEELRSLPNELIPQ